MDALLALEFSVAILGDARGFATLDMHMWHMHCCLLLPSSVVILLLGSGWPRRYG